MVQCKNGQSKIIVFVNSQERQLKTPTELTEIISDFIEKRDSVLFEKIYEKTYGYLFTCAIHILKDEDDAQDVVQDAFIEIYKGLPSIKEPESFLSWAATIVNRKCFAALKKKRDVLVDETTDDEGNITDFFENIKDDDAFIPENLLDDEESVRLIREIIDDLNDAQRLCVVSFYFNEMKQEDIAAEFGMPLNTVKSHLSRAKANIKKAVMDMDKKGTRLYALAPFMLLLFTRDAKACQVAPMSEALKNLCRNAGGKSFDNSADGVTDAIKQGGAVAGKKAIGKLPLIIGTAAVGVSGVIGASIIFGNSSAKDVSSGQETVLEENIDNGSDLAMDSDKEESNDGAELQTNEAGADIAGEATANKELSEDSSEETGQGNAENSYTLKEIVDLSGYESYGIANGGVIPVRKDGMWGAINYEGDQLVPCQFGGLYAAPNLVGTVIFNNLIYDENGYVTNYNGTPVFDIFDSQGNSLYSGECESAVASGSLYGIVEPINVSDDDYYYTTNVKYFDYSGNEVLSTIRTNETCSFIYGAAPDGKITVFQNEANDDYMYDRVGYLDSEGNVSWIGNIYEGPSIVDSGEYDTGDSQGEWKAIAHSGSSPRFSGCPLTSIVDGYFVVMYPPSTDDMCVYDTGLSKITDFEVEGYGGRGAEGTWFREYYYDGNNLINYGQKAVVMLGGKDYLVDFTNPGCYDPSSAVCTYDCIQLSAEKYWLIGDGDKWGYIDHDGKMVNEYDDATEFSNGQALIITDGEAKLIDEDFNEIQNLGQADGVTCLGEMFRIVSGDKAKFYAPDNA